MDSIYSLRVVKDYLEANNIKYVISNSRVGFMLYDHGCRIDLTDDLKMSIQTHPMITGPAFAETAILSVEQKTVVHGKFGYNDVIRHNAPEDLFNHIQEVLKEAQEL